MTYAAHNTRKCGDCASDSWSTALYAMAPVIARIF